MIAARLGMPRFFRIRRFVRTQCRNASVMAPATLELADRLLEGKRFGLARAITLAESTKDEHKEQAAHLIDYVLAHADREKFFADLEREGEHDHGVRMFEHPHTLRLGIAGPPGAGKSTFIEALGCQLVHRGHRVAVIPVDPSSHISGGSILGDKTRMDVLSRHAHAYVRASPTSGVLGGIAEHTNDVITLCEAAGYDVVIVESVGLGQSEVDIDQAVDMLCVLIPPGGGDGLQAAKKGIMEAADLLLINKADGTLLTQAKHTKADYSGAMAFIRQKHEAWKATVHLLSSKEKTGMGEALGKIQAFHSTMLTSHALYQKRTMQSRHWMQGQFRRQLIARTEGRDDVRSKRGRIEADLALGRLSPRAAARRLLEDL